jgi:cytochrome P450
MPKAFTTLLDPDVLRDPHPSLAELRKTSPVFWDPAIEAWIVTRHEDVKAVFADPRFSRDRRLTKFYTPPEPGTWAARHDEYNMYLASPEPHRRWRRQLSAGFTPRAVRRMEGQVRAVVSQFAEPLRGRRGTVDLVAEFTNPIPNTVISRITGIPPYPGDEDRFRRLAQDVIRQFFPMADAENKRRGEQAMNELAEWIGKLAGERRQEPRDDLLSDLIVGNQGEDAMSNSQIIMQVVVLIAAGSETTTLGGTHAIRLLLEHPDQLASLRADSSLVRNAVREVLRFDFGGSVSTPLVALEDLEVGDVTIRHGDMVMCSVSSANRDEAVFDDPDRFDITRDTRDILTFGSGPHYCLGANLAQQELDCMLQGALEFLPEGARLVAEELEWESIGLVRRPVNLPVDFG